MPSQKKHLSLKSLSEDIVALADRVKALESKTPLGSAEGVAEALEDLGRRMSEMEIAKPVELVRLSLKEFQDIVQECPSAEFEVLQDFHKLLWKFSAGAILRADNTPHLVSLVQDGLALGVPDKERAQRVAKAAEMYQAKRREEAAAQDAADASKRAAEAAQQALAAQEELKKAKANMDDAVGV